MRFSDWSSDVCSSDLPVAAMADGDVTGPAGRGRETHADQRRAGGVDAVGLGVHRNHARRKGFGYPAIKRRLIGDADIVVMVEGRVIRFARLGRGRRGRDVAAQLRQQRAESLIGEKRLQRLRRDALRSEEHTSELQSLMRISYAVFCLKKK